MGIFAVNAGRKQLECKNILRGYCKIVIFEEIFKLKFRDTFNLI